VARAAAAGSFLRSRRRRFRPSAYQLYTIIVVGAIVGALGQGLIETLIGGGLTINSLAVFGPAVLVLLVLAAARFGCWQGPVSFSAADVALLLLAPIASEELVRPKLDHAMLAGAALGAATGVVVTLVIAGGPTGLGFARVIGSILGLCSVSLLATAVSWVVQSSRRAPPLVRRVSPGIAAAALGVLVLDATAGQSVGIWSGPWGWALAPVAGQPGWPIAIGALVIAAAGLTTYARRRAGASSIESFLTRAGTRSALTAGVVMLDYRSAALTYRAAQPATPSRQVAFPRHMRLAIPRPRQARWAIVWRDALAMRRNPSRLTWAATLAAAATLEALTHPGRLLPAGLAATGIYFAATLLIEPLRVDVDYPDRSAILLPWSFARVLREHCVLPLVTLVVTTTATIVVAVVVEVASPTLLLVIPTLLIPLLVVAVLTSARAARRGGRISEGLLRQLISTDPSNPGAIVIIALLLAPWLILEIAIVGGVIALIRPLLANRSHKRNRTCGSRGRAKLLKQSCPDQSVLARLPGIAGRRFRLRSRLPSTGATRSARLLEA
jgi:hypothetical protein